MRRLLLVITLMLVFVLGTSLGTGSEIPYSDPGGPSGEPDQDHPWGGDSYSGNVSHGTTNRPRYSATTGFWAVDLYLRVVTNPKVWQLFVEEHKDLSNTGTATRMTTGTTLTRTNAR